MTALTTEQLQAIERAGIDPIRLEDPSTRRTYVLISEDEYRRLRDLLPDRTPNLEEQRVLLAGLGRSVGWDDPAMDIYDDL
jgi:hypothetical protein